MLSCNSLVIRRQQRPAWRTEPGPRPPTAPTGGQPASAPRVTRSSLPSPPWASSSAALYVNHGGYCINAVFIRPLPSKDERPHAVQGDERSTPSLNGLAVPTVTRATTAWCANQDVQLRGQGGVHRYLPQERAPAFSGRPWGQFEQFLDRPGYGFGFDHQGRIAVPPGGTVLDMKSALFNASGWETCQTLLNEMEIDAASFPRVPMINMWNV